jgi:DNA-binding response OmpR family regulator
VARSDPGHGSSFKLFLPVTPAARTDPAPEAGSAWRGKGRLLLVDPEPAARGAARRMAEQFGFEVLEAQNGPEAIHTFRLQHGTLTLVLLGLPLGHGRATLAAMRRIDPTVPLGLSGPDEVKPGDPAGKGLAERVHQPYRLAEIQGLLQRAMARKPANRNK